MQFIILQITVDNKEIINPDFWYTVTMSIIRQTKIIILCGVMEFLGIKINSKGEKLQTSCDMFISSQSSLYGLTIFIL